MIAHGDEELTTQFNSKRKETILNFLVKKKQALEDKGSYPH
jgi:hypothetical protein